MFSVGYISKLSPFKLSKGLSTLVKGDNFSQWEIH